MQSGALNKQTSGSARHLEPECQGQWPWRHVPNFERHRRLELVNFRRRICTQQRIQSCQAALELQCSVRACGLNSYCTQQRTTYAAARDAFKRVLRTTAHGALIVHVQMQIWTLQYCMLSGTAHASSRVDVQHSTVQACVRRRPHYKAQFAWLSQSGSQVWPGFFSFFLTVTKRVSENSAPRCSMVPYRLFAAATLEHAGIQRLVSATVDRRVSCEHRFV